MNRIINYIIPLTGIVASIVFDLLLIKELNIYLVIFIETLVILILLYFFFQIIEFKEDHLVITRIFRRKRRIRYSIIKCLKIIHYKRVNGIYEKNSSNRFEILIFDNEFFIKMTYDESEKKKIIHFFKEKNVPVQLLESF